ncbi:MAG TPA: alkaline phosphatase D family protein [Crenalkalicoccus sp.]|nr:alkaline phosphatase D family protein [Crenalkalicoccus sp.]
MTAALDEVTKLELRRRAAFRLVFGAGAGLLGLEGPARAVAIGAPQFLHGVASGDPLRDRVIIWTRVTPPSMERLRVQWRVSTTSDMTNVVAAGETNAGRNRDFTVKVDVAGLQPATWYWYQFNVGGVYSPIGRTRTLPASNAVDPFAIAFFSCSNWVKGYFTAYREAARDDSLVAVLHLGDYTYEYGPGGYPTASLALGLVTEPRAGTLDPMQETVMLAAYRQRQALHHIDPDLQALHAKLPWIVIYDDHEEANDSWTGGAENHQPATEGDWKAREAAALQAYYEWMPIREHRAVPLLDPTTQNPTQLYRTFTFGQLARIICLDTRLAGRNQQMTPAQMLAAYTVYATTGSFSTDMQADGSPRTLLGAAQEAWVDEKLSTGRQTWQILANQVLMHYQIAPDYLNSPLLNDQQKAQITATIDAAFGAGSGAAFGQAGANGLPNPATYDSWNGYPSARQRLYASLAKARNPIVISGDSHNGWAASLAVPAAGGGRTPVGVEFGGTSVSSPGYEETFPGFPPALIAGLITSSSQAKSRGDTLVYADTYRRGYVKLAVAADKVTATYVFLSTVFDDDSYTVDATRHFEVLAGAKKISGS